ncbi:MAG: hypothetical protein DI605_04965 [Sphingomonas sp.]|nr:MAG: hypothetical protein DI605_04965 [Sphingomonas sp.]
MPAVFPIIEKSARRLINPGNSSRTQAAPCELVLLPISSGLAAGSIGSFDHARWGLSNEEAVPM